MKNFQIKRITKAQCEEVLNRNHYLSKQGFSFRSGFNYGLYDGDNLIGVAVFHTISAWETAKGMFGLQDKEQNGFYELGRFTLEELDNKRNIASWFLARCIKRLRSETEVRALLTYADTDLHKGFIYQALNFKYYGLTAPKSDFWVLQGDGTYKKQSRGKTKGLDGEWRPRSRKHRYLHVYDKTLTVRWKEEKYPK